GLLPCCFFAPARSSSLRIFNATKVGQAQRYGSSFARSAQITDQVSQVILVTHKRPETQNTIELKK
ncbi:MAG: hypothetical protein RLN85_19825, partial [Pseudomonadales bacterium]